MKQVIFRLLKVNSLHFAVQFLIMAMLVSVMIVLSIDFIWDGRFNAELEFAGVVTPFLDGLFLVVFVNAMLDEIREELASRKQSESAITEQLEELRHWHDITLGREGRILELKHEINQLLAQTGQPPRYPSAES